MFSCKEACHAMYSSLHSSKSCRALCIFVLLLLLLSFELLSQESMQFFLVFTLRFLITRGQGYAVGESMLRITAIVVIWLVIVVIIIIVHGQVFSIGSNGFVRPSNGPLHDVVATNNGGTKVNETHDALSPFGQRYPHALVDGLFESFVALIKTKEPTSIVVVVDWYCWSHDCVCVSPRLRCVYVCRVRLMGQMVWEWVDGWMPQCLNA